MKQILIIFLFFAVSSCVNLPHLGPGKKETQESRKQLMEAIYKNDEVFIKGYIKEYGEYRGRSWTGESTEEYDYFLKADGCSQNFNQLVRGIINTESIIERDLQHTKSYDDLIRSSNVYNLCGQKDYKEKVCENCKREDFLNEDSIKSTVMGKIYLGAVSVRAYNQFITLANELAKKELSNEADKKENENRIAKAKANDEWSVYDDSDLTSCSFWHKLIDNTFGSMRAWAKKDLGMSDITNETLSTFKNYVDYERTRLRSNLVFKPIQKPNIVIVQIRPLGIDKMKLAKTEADKRKISKFNDVYSVSSMGWTPFFFEDMKKIPCGTIAMRFSDLKFEDFGVVIRGAKFIPSNPKK